MLRIILTGAVAFAACQVCKLQNYNYTDWFGVSCLLVI